MSTDKPEPLSDEMIEALRADATAEEPHISCCGSDTVLRLIAVLDSLRRDLCREWAKSEAGTAEGIADRMGWTELDWDAHEPDPPRADVDRPAFLARLVANRWHMTGRESMILARVIDGKTNEAIGEELEISRTTVKWHIHNMFHKTGATNREGLLRLVIELDARIEQDVRNRAGAVDSDG